MAKKTKDAALDFLTALGISPAKIMQDARAQLIAGAGDDLGKRLLNTLIRQKDADATDLGDYYAEKNANLDLALTVSGAVDGDVVRKMCRWIDYHRRQLGKTILDVGCDCGLISCFAARQMPYAHVVGIDLREESVAVARQLVDRLGLNNVEFRCASVYDLAGETFDTVLASRVLRENLTEGETDPMLLLDAQARCYAAKMERFAQALTGLCGENGSLVSVEQLGRRAPYLGWLYALGAQGFVPAKDYLREQPCTVADAPEGMLQILAASKGQASDEALYQLFAQPYQPVLKKCSWIMDGFDGEVFVQSCHGDLIEGYAAYFPDGRRATKIAFWECKTDPRFFLSEQKLSDGKSKLFYCLMETLPEERQSLHKDVNNFLRQGWTVKQLSYIDGGEVESDLPEKP